MAETVVLGADQAPGAEASAGQEDKEPIRPLTTGAAAKAEVQKILRQSFDWLDAGEEEKARVELEHAMLLEPDNKQVNCLLRGITVDAQSVLGSESTPYTVTRGDSLGSIAKRFMGDVCEFYILARYNQIKVPKQLSAGQTIRVPGRIALSAPPSPAVVVPAPAVKPAVANVPPPKPEPAVEALKIKPVPAAEDPKVRAAAIDRHYRSGVDAYRRQNLVTAIREFDAVLALDPNHSAARVRRQEALDLKAKLDAIPK